MILLLVFTITVAFHNASGQDVGLQLQALYIKTYGNVDSPPTNSVYGRPGKATDTHSCNHIRGVPSHLRSSSHMSPRGLGQFYQKYTEAYGIPVLGSIYLSDDAMKRACYTVRFLFADRYDVRNSYYKKYGRFALMGVNEVTTHIPEHTDLGASWNYRARGLGATTSRPVSTGGEENALCMSSDRYRSEDILLHEFVHGVHLLGAHFAISGFDRRVKAAYNAAKYAGRWANTYAMSTDHEYLAEGAQSYFNVNAFSNPSNGIHNHVNTREKLKAYDPTLYDLVEELFPCGNTYIKRCQKDRDAELSQVLKMNCDGNTGTDGGGSGNGCEDDNQHCPGWAKQGYCSTNSYVEDHCKKSCDLCEGGGGTATTTTTDGTATTTTTTATTAPPVNCMDLSEHCAWWASKGECAKNPGYMNNNCKLSCNKCDNACSDNNTFCGNWARSGECEKNPGYMLIHCKRSCQVC